jgi:hypothetical protein
MSNLTFPTGDFVPFTKIRSSEVNGKFDAVQDKFNEVNQINRSAIEYGTAHQVVINAANGSLSGVNPSTSGNVLTSDGTQWVSSPPAGGNSSSTALANLSLAVSNPTLSTTGNTSNGSNQLTSLASTTNLHVGQLITGTGIPANTVVSAIAGTTVTMSANASATNTGTSVTFNSLLLISVKQTDGTTDPTSGAPSIVAFRSSTATSGAYNQRNITSALSCSLWATATLGTAASTAHYVYVYALDNAGTVELAASLVSYDTGAVRSTTAMSTSADSNNVLYSTTARSNVPVRVIGRLLISQTTAGLWTAAPTEVSLAPFIYLPGSINCRAKKSGLQSISSATYTIVTGYTKSYDSHNAFDTTTGKFTCPVDGVYQVSGQVSWENALGAGTYIGIAAAKGNTLDTGMNFLYNAAAYGRPGGTTRVKCVAGDTLAIMAYQETGGARDLNADNFCWIAVEYLGP